MLTNAEIRLLCDALRRGPGSRSLEADLYALSRWALTARVDQALLEMVLEGSLLVERAKDGDWAFRMTPEGTARHSVAGGGDS
jgi:hypothetical protein